jgi:hypothetical protein
MSVLRSAMRLLCLLRVQYDIYACIYECSHESKSILQQERERERERPDGNGGSRRRSSTEVPISRVEPEPSC